MTGLLAALYVAASGRSFAVSGRPAAATIAFLAVFPTLTAFFIQMWAQRFTPRAALGGALIVAAMMAGELSKLDLLRGRRKEVLPS